MIKINDGPELEGDWTLDKDDPQGIKIIVTNTFKIQKAGVIKDIELFVKYNLGYLMKHYCNDEIIRVNDTVKLIDKRTKTSTCNYLEAVRVKMIKVDHTVFDNSQYFNCEYIVKINIIYKIGFSKIKSQVIDCKL